MQIGMVGCGRFAESHLQAYRAVPTAQVAALYDIDRGRAAALAARFGVPTVCASLEELCRLSNLQAIDVVASEAAHCQAVLEGVNAGKHVFVEKPLAASLDECDAMIAAARAARRYLMVGHV
ncbi:MAG TPA: Gfo/Idh/MocA family oxidoreductase, partial [Pirellulales bacterium]|nr:Gfo/Idh/MocA family oxidoreductase [Pirellulales bacterium]